MKHLEEINESYFQHLRFAWSVAFVLLVHGLFPWIWEDKASKLMEHRVAEKVFGVKTTTLEDWQNK